MMSDTEVRDALAKLTDRMGAVETEVRVVKHDLANMQHLSQGLAAKLEKTEERLSAKIDTLTDKIGTLNIKQERGAAFFAGIAAVATVCGGLLLALAKILFGVG